MSEAADMRPRGIVGTMHNGVVQGVAIADTPKTLTVSRLVDGDDMTSDWWDIPSYDVRPGPERLEHIITDLVQRVETLEAIIRDWSGD